MAFDFAGAFKSAAVTSGIGAPLVGVAPWHIWHLVERIWPTSHGSVPDVVCPDVVLDVGVMLVVVVVGADEPALPAVLGDVGLVTVCVPGLAEDAVPAAPELGPEVAGPAGDDPHATDDTKDSTQATRAIERAETFMSTSVPHHWRSAGDN